MYLIVYIITYPILVNADVDKVISEENFDTYQAENVRKAGKLDETMPRRFLEDLNDYDFHISHLKDAELDSGKRHCKETFEDKVKNYKRMLANDASRIEFVLADPIPVDEKDLVPDKCEVVDSDTVGGNSSVAIDNVDKTDNVTKKEDANKEEKLEVRNAATTVKVKGKIKRKDDKGRRASEYLFSSVEYYDEVADFDERVCPDAVQVVKLMIDAIKPYDVECELMLQWQSLK